MKLQKESIVLYYCEFLNKDSQCSIIRKCVNLKKKNRVGNMQLLFCFSS